MRYIVGTARRTPYLYANEKHPPKFSSRPDKQFFRPQYSTHPYRDMNTGRRKVYDTSKTPSL